MNKKKVLWITGAGGTVGSRLVLEAARRKQFEQIWAFTHTSGFIRNNSPGVTWSALDITNQEALQAAARHNPPDVVVNLAAMTNVDACELFQNEACRVNAGGPGQLAEICRQHGTHMLQVSTDYVFPGDESQPGPYREDSKPSPINHYGQTKLDGERAVVEVCAGQVPYTIVRTSQVYGSVAGNRQNFVTWLVSKLQARERVRICREQWSTPTLADDLAKVLLWIVDHERTGIYHAAGPQVLSLRAWLIMVVDFFELDGSLIEWTEVAASPQITKRPLYSGLLCERLTKDIALGAPSVRVVSEGLACVDWHSSGNSHCVYNAHESG